MEQQTIEQLFKVCKPLMRKLGEEDYDYQFDVLDLAVIPALDQLLTQLASCTDLDSLSDSVLSDIVPYDLLWLHAFSDMRVILREHAKQAPSEAYYPFRQRLKTLERGIDEFLACGILRPSDDYELLLIAEVAQENPLYLSIAEKMLAIVNAEVGGDPAPEMTRQEWILLYEFRLQLLKYGHESVCPSDYRKPSTVIQEEWLYAHKRGQTFIMQENKAVMGKWIIFVSADEVDRLWKKIARATSEGQLGIAAKISTAKPKKTKHTYDFVLYVYTQDYHDQQDVFRVRSRLTELGITQEIVYRQECPSSKEAKQQNLYVK
jgi:hypothetical protein